MTSGGGEGRRGRGRWSGCLKGEGRPSWGRGMPADAGGDPRVHCSRKTACPVAERDSEHPVHSGVHKQTGGG